MKRKANGVHRPVDLDAVEALGQQREALVASLLAERAPLAERLRLLDLALSRLGEMPRDRGGRRAGTYGGPHTKTARAVEFVRTSPGAGWGEIHTATGIQAWVLTRLVQEGRLRREGKAGSFQYYPAVPNESVAQEKP